MQKKWIAALCAAAGLVPTVKAQSFFTPTPQYLVPSTRGQAGTEFSWWDVLYSASTYGNYPDMAAPSGPSTEGYASDFGITPPPNSNPGDPYAFWDASNPTLTQNGTTTAFIIAPGTSGNIYSPAGTTAYQLDDTTPYTLGSVQLQWQTQGTLMDFSSLVLVYSDGFSEYEIAPTNFITEYRASSYHGGAFAPFNRVAAQWDLTGLDITSYSLKFKPEGTSCSLQELLLDTSATYTEQTPSSRTWQGGGVAAQWSNPQNWAGNALPSHAGNLVLPAGQGLVVDGGARTVSQVTLTAPGGFVLSAAAGSSLQINSGISVLPEAPASYTISAPVRMGSFNLIELNANATLTLAGVVSGNTGFYRFGGGVLKMTADNTFTGGLLISGGITEISGKNSYLEGTTVLTGQLILKGLALLSGSGTLGASLGEVTLGADAELYGNVPEASIIIDGPFTVGKPFYVNFGNSLKRLGARNTGAGAAYTGNIALTAGTGGLRLDSEMLTDRVTFSGSITGGGPELMLRKTGEGTVVFGAGAKTYKNDTYIENGTLEIAPNATLASPGKIVIQDEGALLVHGSLSGTAELTSFGGTIGGSGTISRPFTIDFGDILTPGQQVNRPIGTLHTVAETWGKDGELHLEINAATGLPGANWDAVEITGALTFSATLDEPFRLTLATLTPAGIPGVMDGFDLDQPYTWRIATTTLGFLNFNPEAFAVDLSRVFNPTDGTFFLSVSEGNLYLNYLPVPEPSSVVLAGLAVIGLATRRIRAGRMPRA